ncbi:hypothetical protein SAMN04489726_3149 [Allokutzneria albata]|uniref:Transposase DDE domain-containing protein n=1 Tax=Allokutzneria albata TaxID=211114 RepID=A0A1G9VQ24_ALLAB|nr:hypothetical protein SAMN04489726_3149 [Allokutzneria albata]
MSDAQCRPRGEAWSYRRPASLAAPFDGRARVRTRQPVRPRRRSCRSEPARVRLVRGKGIKPLIARRGTEHGSGLGIHRWVIEQTFALLHWFRRLRIRREIRDDIHEAFLNLACGIICWRRLRLSSN